MKNYIEVQLEVTIRKYDVETKAIAEYLRKHRNKTNRTIAEEMDLPETMVAHWFRTDRYGCIPPSEHWQRLKDCLNITDNEYDKAVMEFCEVASNFDMANRIYIGQTAPTLTACCEKLLFLI